jgi:DNA-binding response OmpR family regulator
MAKKLLIVEDEENARQFYTEDFKEAGFDVVCVPNGMKAIQYAEKEPVDLVITDIRMPEVGGMALVPYLDKFNSKVPIIIVSAYEQYKEILLGENKNVKDYFVKPVNMASLIARVKEVLESPDTVKVVVEPPPSY